VFNKQVFFVVKIKILTSTHSLLFPTSNVVGEVVKAMRDIEGVGRDVEVVLFLVYVNRTYPTMIPYLKGFNLHSSRRTIADYHPNSA
jgi:hypothetical protein